MAKLSPKLTVEQVTELKGLIRKSKNNVQIRMAQAILLVDKIKGNPQKQLNW